MKCYICLTDSVIGRKDYFDLLEVTLSTARRNTTLRMVCLYDGRPGDEICRLLEKYGVETIFHSFSFKKELMEIYPESWMKDTLGKTIPYSRLFGAFMRIEIPMVEKEEEYVLYTDIDVYFNGDILPDDLPKPRYLAAAPECDMNFENEKWFNSGVLLMNIEGMKEKYAEFSRMMSERYRASVSLFDQGYLSELCWNDFDLLPLEYNWKPYWGINDNARIIHFHGMKPGSELSGAGFNTSNWFFYKIFGDYEQGFAGYSWYFKKFYDELGRSDDKWLYRHLQSVLDLYRIGDGNKLARCQKKLKKYRCLSVVFMIFTIILMLSAIALLLQAN